jgi:hypothetical protein
MPTIYAASESAVLVNGEAIEGVTSIEYRRRQVRTSIYSIGGSERIGLSSGPITVDGRILVTSASATLDALGGGESFQVAATLRQGETQVSVSFDECYMVEKAFEMGAGAHGQAVYAFTATRVREDR